MTYTDDIGHRRTHPCVLWNLQRHKEIQDNIERSSVCDFKTIRHTCRVTVHREAEDELGALLCLSAGRTTVG